MVVRIGQHLEVGRCPLVERLQGRLELDARQAVDVPTAAHEDLLVESLRIGLEEWAVHREIACVLSEPTRQRGDLDLFVVVEISLFAQLIGRVLRALKEGRELRLRCNRDLARLAEDTRSRSRTPGGRSSNR